MLGLGAIICLGRAHHYLRATLARSVFIMLGWACHSISHTRHKNSMCCMRWGWVQVYAVDLRHHGDSATVPARGYHIARLAADLRDFLQALNLADVTGQYSGSYSCSYPRYSTASPPPPLLLFWGHGVVVMRCVVVGMDTIPSTSTTSTHTCITRRAHDTRTSPRPAPAPALMAGGFRGWSGTQY